MHPPKLPLRFFRWFCKPDLKKYIEGDLMELYHERVKDSGKRVADLRFWLDVMLLFRPGIVKQREKYRSINQYGMYKSYFKIGWRNLWKNKGYSAINIGGLALGMTVAMLIGFWIYDELSFNKNYDNYNTIARVYRKGGNENKYIEPVQPTGLGTMLREEYSAQFEKVVLVRQRREDRILAFGDKKFSQSGYFMQPEGTALFSLKMIRGVQDGLRDMKSIVLSESLAKKMFGEADPINQIVTMDASSDLTVTGVYEDLPKNAWFNEATYFAPLDLYLSGWSNLNVWDNYNMHVYVQLRREGDEKKASGIIRDAMKTRLANDPDNPGDEIFLYPMSKWHLYDKFENGVSVISERMKFVWFFGITAMFVLGLACINFMNLSTARSEKRAKEVGIRKAIGSQRGQLVQQFIGESLLIAAMALTVALVLVQLSLPLFNSIADKAISIPWSNYLFLLSIVAFTLVTGLMAGSYPALYLSSFNAIKVLKGTIHGRGYTSTPRRVLVVIQFTFSISLIIATLVVYQQIQFARSRPIGYSREGLLTLHPRSPEYNGKYELLRNEFKRTGVVKEIAAADYPVNSTLGWNGGFEWKNKPKDMENVSFNINEVTPEYGKTIGWEFVSGRDFSRDTPTDAMGVVINETAARMIGLEEPVGETLVKDRGGEKPVTYTILGVIKDVVKGSPFEKTDQCMYFQAAGDPDWLFLRIDPNVSAHDALAKIEKVFTHYIPSAPFDYKFADDEFAAKFSAEERIGTLASIFSSFAIFISCAGLFGLASFVAEQRTKEIGIRKVMGASIAQVWRLLSYEFVMLIIISCTIAIPLSYYFMNNWLQQYKYHTSIPWYVFVVTSTGAMLITLATVSIQAIKAAIANPVKSLRTE